MSDYYIQNKEAGFLGNSPIWWAKNGQGYTAYILGAERFSETEAARMVMENPDKWEMYKCDHVDRRLHLVFDHQDKKRLGTDEESGWEYAGNRSTSYVDEAIKAAKLEVIDAILIKAIPSEEKTELIDYIDELKQQIESE